MKKLPLIFLIIALISCCMYSATEANDLSGRLGVGLGNPYISCKYGINSKFSAEIRAAFGKGISVYGVRGYYNFNPQNTSVLFLGLEGNLINFDKKDISGHGSVLMAFAGFEHFITKALTFSLDIGPAYISLSSEGISVGGIEWVYNLGVNFYFH